MYRICLLSEQDKKNEGKKIYIYIYKPVINNIYTYMLVKSNKHKYTNSIPTIVDLSNPTKHVALMMAKDSLACIRPATSEYNFPPFDSDLL